MISRISKIRRRSRALLCTWNQNKRMDDETFQFMRDVLAAPSPVGLEASMTRGVLSQRFAEIAKPDWKEITFKGNAGIVWDTGNEDDVGLTVMIVGHADKIRMQVRSIDPTVLFLFLFLHSSLLF
jgi:putative aminopeptidase FrvX